jgi:sugar phosphate isomerase/epimerase
MQFGISISPLRTGFGPVLYDTDMRGLCEGLAAAGYDGVEVSLVTPEAFAPALAKAIGAAKLKVFAIATGQSYVRDKLCLYSNDDRIREAALARLSGFIPLARKLSCRIIIGGICGNEPREAGMKEKGDEAFRTLAAAAAEQGVGLLLEPINRYETRFFNTVDGAAQFVAAEKLPNVKVLADTFHMNIEEVDIAETVRTHLDQIGYIHVADSNRRFPGAGHVDFVTLLTCLQKNNYSGVVGVEILPFPTPLEAAVQSIQTLRRCLGAARAA